MGQHGGGVPGGGAERMTTKDLVLSIMRSRVRQTPLTCEAEPPILTAQPSLLRRARPPILTRKRTIVCGPSGPR